MWTLILAVCSIFSTTMWIVYYNERNSWRALAEYRGNVLERFAVIDSVKGSMNAKT